MTNENLNIVRWFYLAAGFYVAACWFFELPSEAYVLLRWVAFSGVLLSLWVNNQMGHEWPQAIYFIAGGLAIIFNPFFPIYLYDKSDWFFPDAALCVWFYVNYVIAEAEPEEEVQVDSHNDLGDTVPPKIGTPEFSDALAVEEEKLKQKGDDEKYRDIPF